MDSGEYRCGAETEHTDGPCQVRVSDPDERCAHHRGERSEACGRHEPDAVTEAVVEALAMEGHDQQTIADRLDIHPNTLRKHYREILDRAKLSAHAQVVQTAFAMATSGENPSMTRYWLNCRSPDWASDGGDSSDAAEEGSPGVRDEDGETVVEVDFPDGATGR